MVTASTALANSTNVVTVRLDHQALMLGDSGIVLASHWIDLKDRSSPRPDLQTHQWLLENWSKRWKELF
jgi:hypothetical protein